MCVDVHFEMSKVNVYDAINDNPVVIMKLVVNHDKILMKQLSTNQTHPTQLICSIYLTLMSVHYIVIETANYYRPVSDSE